MIPADHAANSFAYNACRGCDSGAGGMNVELKKASLPAAAAGGANRVPTILFGNEKGGTAKTTTAMHITVALLRLGKAVSAIDLDSRQRTFARYIENRRDFASGMGRGLPLPDVQVVERSKSSSGAAADESARLAEALARAKQRADFVIIDTPGNDTDLSRLGHAAADTLVTPMNDSFLDFDLLAKFDGENLEVKGPSLSSE